MIGKFEIIKFLQRTKKKRASHKNIRVLTSHVWIKKETAGSLRSCCPSFKIEELFEAEYESLTSVPV